MLCIIHVFSTTICLYGISYNNHCDTPKAVLIHTHTRINNFSATVRFYYSPHHKDFHPCKKYICVLCDTYTHAQHLRIRTFHMYIYLFAQELTRSTVIVIALSTQLVRFLRWNIAFGSCICYRRAVSILRFIETYPNV